MTDFEKLKLDAERWLQMLGIQPPNGIHDYIPLIMNRVALDSRLLRRQMEDAEAKIVGLKEALFQNADRYIEVDVYNYATGTHLFPYSFRNCDPLVGDVIEMEENEYQVVGRRWEQGELCLLVSNAGVVKDSGFIWNTGG
jgi:hypothetical protein